MTIEEEGIFQEYLDLKIGVKDIIDSLMEDAPDVYYRFRHVIDALDELCSLVSENEEEFEEHREELFYLGVDELREEIDAVYEIVKYAFDNDYVEFNKFYKEFNLYLEVKSFLEQIEYHGSELGEKLVKKYKHFAEVVRDHIIDKKHLPVEKYDEFNTIIMEASEYGIEYTSYNALLWDLADELDVLDF